ncbi:MAG: hypothetical protein JW940_39090 [Polyangiaceae bacterium]|nr:hypothetical protein [Polyangiaceae bacterium]
MLTRSGNTELRLVGPAGSFECAWAMFSLFWDNVEHHVAHGARRADFRALRGIAAVVGTSRRVVVPARDLHSEVLSSWAMLGAVSADELRISVRTAAVLNNAWPLPDATHTVPVSQADRQLPIRLREVRTGAEAFDRVIKGLLRITESAVRPDVVWVWPDANCSEADPLCASTAMRG